MKRLSTSYWVIKKCGSSTVYFISTALLASLGIELFSFVIEKVPDIKITDILLVVSCTFCLFIATAKGYKLGRLIERFEHEELELRFRLLEQYRKDHFGNEPPAPEYIDLKNKAYQQLLVEPNEMWEKNIVKTFKHSIIWLIGVLFFLIIRIILAFLLYYR